MATISFNSTNSNLWSDPLNWDLARIPESGDTVDVVTWFVTIDVTTLPALTITDPGSGEGLYTTGDDIILTGDIIITDSAYIVGGFEKWFVGTHSLTVESGGYLNDVYLDVDGGSISIGNQDLNFICRNGLVDSLQGQYSDVTLENSIWTTPSTIAIKSGTFDSTNSTIECDEIDFRYLSVNTINNTTLTATTLIYIQGCYLSCENNTTVTTLSLTSSSENTVVFDSTSVLSVYNIFTAATDDITFGSYWILADTYLYTQGTMFYPWGNATRYVGAYPIGENYLGAYPVY